MEFEREVPCLLSFSSVLSPESGLSSVGVVLVGISCFALFLDDKLFFDNKIV